MDFSPIGGVHLKETYSGPSKVQGPHCLGLNDIGHPNDTVYRGEHFEAQNKVK